MLYPLFLCWALGLLFLFFPQQLHTPGLAFQARRHIVQQDCGSKSVPCVDACDFLCTDETYRCVEGTCRRADADAVQCDAEKGGLVVLTQQHDFPVWLCICTEPSFYGGPHCDTPAPDLCAGGVFEYIDPEHHTCRCPPDRTLVMRNHKPYCLRPPITEFLIDD